MGSGFSLIHFPCRVGSVGCYGESNLARDQTAVEIASLSR